MKKLNNKGFSLVELIIVIAIMVILVAVLAPQFTKYVEKSRIGTDVQNASEIATAAQVAYTEGKVSAGDSQAVATSTLTSLTAIPKTKSDTVGKNQNFTFSISSSGAVTVYGNSKELFPGLDSAVSAKLAE